MKRSFFIVLIIFICFSQVSADSVPGKASIEINLPSRTLSLYKDNSLMKEYPVCIGKQSTPTPQGEYRVVYKTVNPYWINKDVVVPPGPQNPLGARWMGITKNIGIHGNNKPESIGSCASAGCIRMYNRDVEEIYTLVSVNTPVAVKYDRIKLFEDKYSGENAVIIYPDIYKMDGNIKQLMEKLSRMSIPEELAKKIQKLFIKPISKPLAVSWGIGVFMENTLVTSDAFYEQGEIFINYKAAEDLLGMTSETVGLHEIGIRKLEGTIYINLTQTVKCFGGSMSYDEASGNAYINMKIVKVNGVFAGMNYGDFDKTDLIGVETVKQLGYRYSEDIVDLRIFDRGLMKLKRKNVWSVNVDNIIEALGGYKTVNSMYGTVDLKLPVFLKLGEEYYKTDNIDGRLVLNTETAYSIREKSGGASEAFSAKEENIEEKIDLKTFLEDYDYAANNFGTVIEIKVKEI